MLILQKHLTVLVITSSVTNYYPMVLTAICIACWKIFLLIDRSVQELATPVLRISISVAVLFRVVAWVHYCLSYTSMIIVQLFDGLCVCKLYADDLKLYSIVESRIDPQTKRPRATSANRANPTRFWRDEGRG